MFTVPLVELLEEAHWEVRTHPYRGREYEIWHCAYDGEDIWGATAAMLRGMLAMLR